VKFHQPRPIILIDLIFLLISRSGAPGKFAVNFPVPWTLVLGSWL
jgi:ABC-type tungstate transport system substrate-binding protein